MKAAGPVEIVLDVVGAVPKKLDGHAGDFRNPRRLDHVIVHQPPAETAADPRHVNDDIFFLEPSVFATSARPGSGFWVGAQISALPSCTWAVQFIGSSVA